MKDKNFRKPPRQSLETLNYIPFVCRNSEEAVSSTYDTAYQHGYLGISAILSGHSVRRFALVVLVFCFCVGGTKF